jgi:hypothetical protein
VGHEDQPEQRRGRRAVAARHRVSREPSCALPCTGGLACAAAIVAAAAAVVAVVVVVVVVGAMITIMIVRLPQPAQTVVLAEYPRVPPNVECRTSVPAAHHASASSGRAAVAQAHACLRKCVHLRS